MIVTAPPPSPSKSTYYISDSKILIGLTTDLMVNRECSHMPRGQFDCICLPQVTTIEPEMMEAVVEILSHHYNDMLAAKTDTVCARLIVHSPVRAQVNS